MSQSAEIAYLDGARLGRGLRAGIRRVIADQDHLNLINVFPVPDGDTGTNLAMTLNTVSAAIARSSERHAGRMLELVADSALDGARGNSGAIVAQFFLGLGDAAGELPQLTTEDLVDAVRRGADYAREAMNEPREGTLLTVLDAFAEELVRVRDHGHDLMALLESGLTVAQQALAATTAQLEALRRAGVVDAGAQGFVDLLEGIRDFMRDGSILDVDADRQALRAGRDSDHEYEDSQADAEQDSHFRYCSECMITGDDIDRRALRETLSPLGDSIVVAGTRRKVRVHMHIDDPEQLFTIAAEHGLVSSRKADDMHRQQSSARAAGNTVAIVTDSAGDWQDEDFERLGIHMVPVRVHFGDKSYLDKIGLSPEQFYHELQTNPLHPKTSQPAPGDFRRLYQFLLAHHAAVISIHLSSSVSGTFQAACSAATRVGGQDRLGPRQSGAGPVILIDSRSASIGQGLIVSYAAELAKAGCGVDEITLKVDQAIGRTRVFALLGDLRFAVRGGRVPRSKKVLADLLRLDPVLATFPDGRIAAGGVLIGRRKRVEKFARFIARRSDSGSRYRIGVAHARNEQGAQRVSELLREMLPQIESHFVTDLGSALGAHGGPGTIVVGIQKQTTESTDGMAPDAL
ncbi:MAG: DegV family protein [Gammaproteobacteria bacterium]